MRHFNNIRHFREFKGYSQNYVSAKLGKSQPALSKIEKEFTRPSDSVIEQLSKILEVPKEKLYSNTQLFLDCNNDTTEHENLNEQISLKTEKETLPLFNNVATALINQLSQNRKLLHEVELNQLLLQQQLNALLVAITDKK